MYYPKFFKRLVSSLIIGGQAINYIFRGIISKNDLFEQLMESGPGSLLIVLITGIAAGSSDQGIKYAVEAPIPIKQIMTIKIMNRIRLSLIHI